MSEKYRPKLHMTPNSGWMNDPNGLVYFNGEYHQFYQYYPNDTVWGPMHWGHKVSKDLISWKELEPALYPDDSGMCFSGSAIVDHNNTSGLFAQGKPGLLAFYTSFVVNKRKLATGEMVDDPIQAQSLAYSQDGYHWKKYQNGAPVIPARGNPDFRDPKVIWHEATQRWVMVVSCGQHIEFYISENLLHWELVSEFGYRYGAHSKGPWECPDLFPLVVEGTDKVRWVLVVGIGEGAHCGGAGTQYFIGDFDGQVFTSENAEDETLWLDFGRDYYATQSFSDIPAKDGRRIVSTWMSNHQYSLELPTEVFRSSMAMPRELFLFESPAGIRLGQRFVNELRSYLPLEKEYLTQNITLTAGEKFACEMTNQPQLTSLEVELKEDSECTVDLYSGREAGFTLLRKGEYVEILSKRIGRFGKERIDAHFPHQYRIKLPLDSKMKLDLLTDNGSLEMLINDGEYSFTNLVFADPVDVLPSISVSKGAIALFSVTTRR
ncbi:glycoside hydrolase family 32 protein [Vibrio sp. JC009]|uniref:glycoside hydrolase family 32 protein n=1 Tax=Vibrio sp. JC009 TaxID=2912314 RepID=UPI0023B05C6A|nr:glycoside hydrolase family 32 protein [Vibrio sp. JC009]WED24620.1 glycoside hydrolase family 32 protein [Vibrio sp. JC009]